MIVVKNKKVLLLGLGLHGGGVATAQWLYRHDAKLVVSDLKTKEQLAASLKQLQPYKNIKFILGRHREQDVRWADMVVYNPGVPKESPYVRLARQLGKSVLNEAALFFDRCPCPIVGIAGTRGKSTTASLIGAMLGAGLPGLGTGLPGLGAGLKSGPQHRVHQVVVAGNIAGLKSGGQAMLSVLDKLTPKHLVALELSSWQLEGLGVVKKSPHIAVITNLYPDHLNRYRTLAAYYRAKQEIFRYQTKNDYLILNAKDKRLAAWAKTAKAHVVFFNAENALAAVTVAKLLGVSDAAIKKVLKSPPVLTGRQEIIATKRGITFVNDTTSTSPEAGIAALERFGSQKNIILIAGGADKKLNYRRWARAVKKYCHLVYLLNGAASYKMARALGGSINLCVGYNKISPILSEAVVYARSGDIILFSPAAASFNLWANEFARGDEFVKAVRRIR